MIFSFDYLDIINFIYKLKKYITNTNSTSETIHKSHLSIHLAIVRPLLSSQTRICLTFDSLGCAFDTTSWTGQFDCQFLEVLRQYRVGNRWHMIRKDRTSLDLE